MAEVIEFGIAVTVILLLITGFSVYTQGLSVKQNGARELNLTMKTDILSGNMTGTPVRYRVGPVIAGAYSAVAIWCFYGGGKWTIW